MSVVVIGFACTTSDLWKCQVHSEGKRFVAEVGFEVVNDLVAGQSVVLSEWALRTSWSCAGEYPRPPIVPIPPALETAAARGPPEVLAMPASMMGYLIPSSLHSGVLRGGGDDMVIAELAISTTQ